MKQALKKLLGGRDEPERVDFNQIPMLSAKEGLILQLLIANGESFGLALVAASHGELKRGTVYVTLDRMEDKGYVESRSEDKPLDAIGLPRRLYKPTGHGVRVLRAWELLASTFSPRGAST